VLLALSAGVSLAQSIAGYRQKAGRLDKATKRQMAGDNA